MKYPDLLTAAIPCALVFFTTTALFAQDAATEDKSAELAKQLSNPVASLISVPLQSNFDFGAGVTFLFPQ